MRLAALLVVVSALAGCGARPDSRAAAVEVSSLDAEAGGLLAQARLIRRGLEAAEVLVASEIPAEPSRRAVWRAALGEIRSALAAARTREADLSLLVD